MRLIARIASFAFLLLLPGTALAASLSIAPAAGTYTVGSTITLQVLVSSADQSINAVSGVLSFTPSVFSIESVSKNSSILNFWPTDPSISQSSNTVSFEGVTTSGFQGDEGNVLTIVLRAAQAGTGTISFQSGQVLADDGNGTDITSGLSGGSLTVTAAPAKPAPAPVTASAPTPAPAPSAQQQSATTSQLQAPVITSVTNPVALGSSAQVVGASIYPGATTTLVLQSAGGATFSAQSVVENDGSFLITLPYTSQLGEYTGMVTVEQGGAQSLPSEPFTIEFENSPSQEIVGFVSQPGFLTALALIAAFLLGLYSMSFIHGTRKRNQSTLGILHEVDLDVHEAFVELRKPINKSIEKLEKESERRALTKAELQFIREMTGTIKETEKLIDKDIHDAEK